MSVESFFRRTIRRGTLVLTLPDGSRRHYGQGQPRAEWQIHKRKALLRIVADPEFMLGQAYMDGDWDAGEAGLPALLKLLMLNFPPGSVSRRARALALLLKPLQQWNRRTAARRNVASHYDLDEELFRAFLDRDLQYSCAYFRRPELSLEAAQQAKCEHIRRKLCLQPEQRVLDIGCGWGGLAIHLARESGVEVTGLTLSAEQARVARQRVRRAGLDQQVRILEEDYREHRGAYERIVSVGMFEHVGAPNYSVFFDKLRALLEHDGVALIHTIGRCGPPSATNAWIRRYVFPGGYVPAMSEVLRAVERSGLYNADIEVLRLHYAQTLAAWRRRFMAVRPQIAARKGEAFCRMWEFYLASCEASFRWRDLAVFQFQLSTALDTVPITRDYLYRPAPGEPVAEMPMRAV